MAQRHPLFVQKVQRTHPGKQVEIWIQDESRFGQKGCLSRVWALRGSRPVMPLQNEYEWVYLYGAVNPETGESCALVLPWANTEMMQLHLNAISTQVGPDRHVVLVLDNAGWHGSKRLRIPENITLLPLPPYCPELNDIERVWKYLKGASLANYDCGQAATLREAIVGAFEELNASTETELTLRFRDPLSKYLLQVA